MRPMNKSKVEKLHDTKNLYDSESHSCHMAEKDLDSKTSIEKDENLVPTWNRSYGVPEVATFMMPIENTILWKLRSLIIFWITVSTVLMIYLITDFMFHRVRFVVETENSSSAFKQYHQILDKISGKDPCDYECMENFIISLPHLDEYNEIPLSSATYDEIVSYPKRAMQCDIVPVNLRFDCSQDNIDMSPDSCEARGCCWKVVEQDEIPPKQMARNSKLYSPLNEKENATRDPKLDLNIPYCYYPQNYSLYSFSEIKKTLSGIEGTMKKNFNSGLPKDVSVLHIEILYETCSRLRIRIFDKNNKRWETPIPKVPSYVGCSGSELYSVDLLQQEGLIVIRRSDSGIPVFDMRNAAPLIYADQFLQLSTLLASPYLYGLGQHLDGLLLDVYWKRRVLWNADQAPIPDGNLYGSHPFYINLDSSGDAYGFFLLNSNAMDVRLQPSPAITFRVIGGILDFYVFLGPSPDHVISQYTDVIGKSFLPPYWSLGYHQCRFGYGTIDRTRKVWKRTRDAGIPFDVQWNDIDYMKNNNDFTYDKDRFSGLPQFVYELHKSGMHYVIITDPGISAGETPGTYLPYDDGVKESVFVKNLTGDTFIGKVWNSKETVFPDFTRPNAILYWGFLIDKFHSEVAFDGLWIDMNEPSNFWSGQKDGCPANSTLENPPYLPPVIGGKLYFHTLCMTAKHYIGSHYDVHNLYGISEVITTYGALRMIQDIPNPIIISRSTFPGIGSFGGHWTGDIHSDWFNMWKSVGDVLTMNMLGIPMVGADICGFNGNTTVPLCNRWMQLGAFYPFARNHNTDDGIDQDPVALGELVVRSSRKALLQRYTMLPYLYSLFFRAHIFGIPVAKPLFFKYPDDSETYALDTQFLWGEAIMIIPVLQENATAVAAYFPADIWYDWYSGKVVTRNGGEYMSLSAPLDTIPIMISGGHIIPCQNPGNTTTESRQNPYFIVVALNKVQQAYGELFWSDEGVRDPFEKSKYIHWKFKAVSNQLTIQVTPFAKSEEKFTLGRIQVLGVSSKVFHVRLNGSRIHFKFSAVDQILELDNLAVNFLQPVTVNWGL